MDENCKITEFLDGLFQRHHHDTGQTMGRHASASRVQTAMVVSVAVWMTVEGTAAAVCAARAALAAVRAAGAACSRADSRSAT